jgi:hypothetical protein
MRTAVRLGSGAMAMEVARERGMEAAFSRPSQSLTPATATTGSPPPARLLLSRAENYNGGSPNYKTSKGRYPSDGRHPNYQYPHIRARARITRRRSQRLPLLSASLGCLSVEPPP